MRKCVSLLALAALLVSLGACNEPDVIRIVPDVGSRNDAFTAEVIKREPGTCPAGASLGCVTAYSRKICNDEGTAFIELACPAGQICVGAALCQPAICLPGQTTCLAPDKVGQCSADGSGYDLTDTCKLGLSCVEGECVSSCNSAVKAQTNVGCNYALVDLGNFESFPQGSESDHPVVVVVSNTLAQEEATIEILSNQQGEPLPFTEAELRVPPQGLKTYTLPVGSAQLETSINRWSWFLTSDQPVTVHLINPANGPDVRSNDATLLFPTDALGNDYLVMGWKSFWTDAQGFDELGYPKYGFPSYVTIVATSQGVSDVTVTPSANIRGGQVVGGSYVEPLAKGQTKTYSLNHGDVLNFTVEPQLGDDYDLTGTQISSTRPLAVFSAHNCAFVPSISVKFCDHLEHQLTPVKTWDKTYVADMFSPRADSGFDVWRVMAAENETAIDTDPKVPELSGVILNKGEWIEYQSSFPHVITASGRIQVGHYMTGSNIPGFEPVCGDNLTGIGDPAFTIGVGVEQYLDSYIVLTPPGYSDDFINVVREAGTAVLLDGVEIEGEGLLIGETLFELLHVPVQDGVHRLESTKPFGATAYGYDCDVSYAYPGGMLLGDTTQ